MGVDITELFEMLIKKHSDLESAQAVLKKELEEDESLAEEYSEWCSAMGHSERKGFAAFYHEYLEHRDAIWDSIFPNSEEYDGYEFRS